MNISSQEAFLSILINELKYMDPDDQIECRILKNDVIRHIFGCATEKELEMDQNFIKASEAIQLLKKLKSKLNNNWPALPLKKEIFKKSLNISAYRPGGFNTDLSENYKPSYYNVRWHDFMVNNPRNNRKLWDLLIDENSTDPGEEASGYLQLYTMGKIGFFGQVLP